MERVGIHLSTEKERIKNIRKGFEECIVTLARADQGPELLPRFLENLLHAERLRLDLYKASLRILQLRKHESVETEYYGKVRVDVELKPRGGIISGKVVRAHVKITNLSALIQRLRLYAAWYHPAHVLSKWKQEEVELMPLGTATKIYICMPRAKGKHEFRISVFKGKMK